MKGIHVLIIWLCCGVIGLILMIAEDKMCGTNWIKQGKTLFLKLVLALLAVVAGPISLGAFWLDKVYR